jgi:predicted RNA-binding protein Jag
MNSVEKTGKTVKEATDLALSELNVKEDDAIIEVLDEGNKGIFGLFNTRMAKVKVTVKKRISHEGKEFLQALLKKMDLEAQVEVRENEDTIIYKNANILNHLFAFILFAFGCLRLRGSGKNFFYQILRPFYV